jgi:hypothetical protein
MWSVEWATSTWSCQARGMYRGQPLETTHLRVHVLQLMACLRLECRRTEGRVCPCRLIIWRPLKPMFFKYLFNIYLVCGGGGRKCFSFSQLYKWSGVARWVNCHHISDYSRDVLAPLIGWHPGQLPGWLALNSALDVKIGSRFLLGLACYRSLRTRGLETFLNEVVDFRCFVLRFIIYN